MAVITLKITYYKDNGDKVTRGYQISDQEYLMVIKKLDAALLKSWFDNYYYIINKLDTYQYLTYALPGESENEIRTENDILLFKIFFKESCRSLKITLIYY